MIDVGFERRGWDQRWHGGLRMVGDLRTVEPIDTARIMGRFCEGFPANDEEF